MAGGRFGLGKTEELSKGNAQIDKRCGGARIELSGGLKFGGGLFVFAKLKVTHAEIVTGAKDIGIDAQSFFQMGRSRTAVAGIEGAAGAFEFASGERGNIKFGNRDNAAVGGGSCGWRGARIERRKRGKIADRLLDMRITRGTTRNALGQKGRRAKEEHRSESEPHRRPPEFISGPRPEGQKKETNRGACAIEKGGFEVRLPGTHTTRQSDVAPRIVDSLARYLDEAGEQRSRRAKHDGSEAIT